jgi:SAM-dependent methyltransferase
MHIEDAANTKLPSGAYDCIYNIGLLEHFDDPTRLLNEALRLLAPGGLLFMVIVPEGSPWRSFPVRAVMNPAGTARRLSAAAARRVAARLGKDASLGAGSTVAAAAAEMVRTRHDRQRYVEWMNALGAPRARCLPYNPYFSAYSSPALERWLTLPLYRLHLRLVSWLGRAPRLATAGAIASCDLLLFRKP